LFLLVSASLFQISVSFNKTDFFKLGLDSGVNPGRHFGQRNLARRDCKVQLPYAKVVPGMPTGSPQMIIFRNSAGQRVID